MYGYITSTQHGQLPVGLIAQLVEFYTAIAEVMGSNPVQESTFFSDWLSCVYNCDAHQCLHIFLRSKNIKSSMYSFAR